MTDYRSVGELLVLKDGLQVGSLRKTPKGCRFTYTEEFLRSGENPIALRLPKSAEGVVVEGVANLPTYFAGLLPEGLMFKAVQMYIGSAADDLFAMLAATGSDTIGDVDVQIPGAKEKRKVLNLVDARATIASLLRGEKITDGPMSAIPGAQPKLSLGEIVRSSRKSRYIVKFEPPEFPHLCENEHAFMRLARRCKIDAGQTSLHDGALVVKRFDRVYDTSLNLMTRVHVEDMLQVMDRFPNSKYALEYAEIVGELLALGVPRASLLEALRLYVYSYVIGNGDLHAKNVSVLYSRQDRQWRISPAYDLLSTLPYESVLGPPRMALALEDEAFGRFTISDFVEFGLRFELTERSVRDMVHRTKTAVLKHAPDLLRNVVSSDVIETILDRANSLSPEG